MPSSRALRRFCAPTVAAALLGVTAPASAAAPADEADAATDDSAEVEDVRPPRISGPYLGLTLFGGLGLARINQFGTDAPFTGAGASLRFGQMVLPWLGVGLSGGGNGGSASDDGARQSLGQGALLVDFTFVPAPKRIGGLSLRGSFGFGGGAVNEEGVDGRGGYGGAVFGAGGRYEFFPGAKRYRPTKGGGFAVGPEVGWLGFTPAAAGRPMSNTFFVGLSTAFYFGD